MQAQSGVLPDKAFAEYAYVLAKADRYDEALAVLDLMQDRETPQALNYRGYATRKLGRVDEGIGYYLKAVALDPRNRRQGARLLRVSPVRGAGRTAEDDVPSRGA